MPSSIPAITVDSGPVRKQAKVGQSDVKTEGIKKREKVNHKSKDIEQSNLTADMQLINDLLNTSPDLECENLLIRKALLNQAFIINNDFSYFNEERHKLRYILSKKQYVPALETFEDYVNVIVEEGLSKEEKNLFKFPDYKDKNLNYFMSDNFTELLEKFSQKCMENNLGIIVEAEVNVNPYNNGQAYIRNASFMQLCYAIIPNPLLRKYSLHGDIVRCFIRKNFKDPKPAAMENVTREMNISDFFKAFVIKIVKKVHDRQCTGKFIRNYKTAKFSLFVALDKKLPNMIVPHNLSNEKFRKGNSTEFKKLLYVVEIISWDETGCLGSIKRKIERKKRKIVKWCKVGVEGIILETKKMRYHHSESINHGSNFETKESKQRIYQLSIKNNKFEFFSRESFRKTTFLKEILPNEQKIKSNVFENHVNFIVGKGLSRQEKNLFTFPDYENTNFNYFMSENFTELLEKFSQKCMENNLGIIVETKVNVNTDNNEQAFIQKRDNLYDAIIPNLLLRKYALHGDIVKCFIRKSTEATERVIVGNISTKIKPFYCFQGFVIDIIKKVHNRLCVGTFIANNKKENFMMFAPRNKRLPLIRISNKYLPRKILRANDKKLKNVLYEVEIIDWKETYLGRLKRKIGKCGEIKAENKAILIDNNMYFEQYETKFDEIYKKSLNIPRMNSIRRRDIRSLCIFTINSLKAQEIDYAFSILELPSGNFEVGVHIADLSYFIEENSDLDNLIMKRTTSINLVNKVEHMMPKKLRKEYALLPGVERMAFSIFMKITKDAKVMEIELQKTLIKSCTEFSYEHVQKIIDKTNTKWNENNFPKIHNGFTINNILEKVYALHYLTTIFRKDRFEKGCLSLNRTKIDFNLDINDEPISFTKDFRNTATFLVDEFISIANESVASFINKNYPNISVLRYNLTPRIEYLKKIQKLLYENSEIKLDISTSKTLANSLRRSIETSDDQVIITEIIHHFIAKPMQKGLYFPSYNLDHLSSYYYAPSSQLYAHFTSPMKYYPDILVHRVLTAALYEENTLQLSKGKKGITNEILNFCNAQIINAKVAENLSIDFYFMRYIKSKGYLNMKSVIVELNQNYFSALTLDSGHLIQINFCDLKGQISFKKRSKVIIAKFLKGTLKNQIIKLNLCGIVWLKVYTEGGNLKGTII